MKTLREMMDRLDEISRRDVLKGAGASAALGGAGVAGYKLGQQTQKSSDTNIPSTTNFYYLLGFLIQCLLPNETKVLSNYKTTVKRLYQAMQVEMELMDAQKRNELSVAFSKGATEGAKKVEGWKWMHKEMGNQDRLDYVRNEKLGEYILTQIEPYYTKLQALLKNQGPLDEASLEALTKIDELTGK